MPAGNAPGRSTAGRPVIGGNASPARRTSVGAGLAGGAGACLVSALGAGGGPLVLAAGGETSGCSAGAVGSSPGAFFRRAATLVTPAKRNASSVLPNWSGRGLSGPNQST